MWAIVAAHQAGLSIRTIATATGLSRSRVRRLLQDDAAREIPTWLIDLRDGERASEEAMETEPSSLRPKRTRLDRRTWFWVGLAVACMTSSLAQAQGVLGLDPSGRPRVVPAPLLPEEPLREEPWPSLPAPLLPPLPPFPAEPPELLPLER